MNTAHQAPTGSSAAGWRRLQVWGWLLGAFLMLASATASASEFRFPDGSDEHYFPTTLGKYLIQELNPPIPVGGSGVYSVTLEILATGYWPGQLGFIYGMAGFPLVDSNYHDLGMRTDEWGFRGRDGSAGAERVVTTFGDVFQNVGDQLRLSYDADSQALSIYTKRVGESEFKPEGGRIAFEDVVATGGRELKFAISGICWQPCGVKVVDSDWPVVSEGVMSAAAGVSEPVALPATAVSAATAVDLLDFSLSDGDNDWSDLRVNSLSLAVSGTLNPADLTFRLNGPDADNVSGSWDSNTQRLTFEDLDITVANGEPHTYTVSAWFTDTDGLSNGQTLLLSLDPDDVAVAEDSSLMISGDAVDNGSGTLVSGVNTAPVASNLTVSGTALEGQTLTGSYQFDDVDNDAESGTQLRWQRASDDAGADLTTVEGAVTDTLTLGTADIARYLRFVVTPADGNTEGDTVYSDWVGPVQALNRAPVVVTDLDNQTATQGQPMTLDVADSFSDPDNDELQFSAAGLPAGFAISAQGVIAGTASNAVALAGPYSVTVRATDPQDLSVSSTFELTVLNVNDAPVAAGTIDAQIATQGEAFSLDVSGNFTDPDGSALVFSANGLPDGFSITEDGVITGTANNAAALASPYSVTVTVADPSDLTVGSTFDLTVVNVNDAPIVTSGIGDQNATQGEAFALDVSGNFSDPDNDSLLISATGLPDGFTINDDGVISGTASNSNAQTSPHTITVTAADASDLSVNSTFVLAIADVNDAPVVKAEIGNQIATQGEAFSLDVSGNFTDPDGNALVFGASGLPDGFSITDDGVIIGTANNAVALASPYSVTVTAADPSDLMVSSTFELSVSNVNDGPEITEEIDDQSVTQSSEFTLDVSVYFSDPDGDTLTFTAENLPEGLSISEDGVISGVPGAAAAATSPHTITVTATDSEELTVSLSFELTANALAPPAPVINNEQQGGVIGSGTIIEAGGVVTDGQFNGVITNRGLISGRVTAGAGARINGGTINGDVQGNPDQPLQIRQATIASGSTLSNVVIGAGTILEDGVQLSSNVKFQSLDIIPPGQTLNGALQPLQWSDGDARQVPGLNASVVVAGGQADSMSILRAIQMIEGFEPSGNVIDQNDSNGVLQAELGGAQAAVLPVTVRRGSADMLPGVSINEDGDIVLVTVNHDVVLAFPSLPGNHDLEDVLRAAGLALDYDDRANMVIRGADADSDSLALSFSNGRPLQSLTLETYFSARPDVVALAAHRFDQEGLHSFTDPALANRELFSLVFRDETDTLMEQDIVPVPADWMLLKQTLQALGDVSGLAIDTQGVIRLTLDGVNYVARMGYEVNVAAPCAEQAEDSVCFADYRDMNADGVKDYLVVFPNGHQQVLYVLP